MFSITIFTRTGDRVVKTYHGTTTLATLMNEFIVAKNLSETRRVTLNSDMAGVPSVLLDEWKSKSKD